MDRPYWDVKLETLPVEQRATLREHRLHWQVRRCWDGSPFYRARLEAAGLDPATFGGLADWPRLPILRSCDLPATADWAVAPGAWWKRTDAAAGQPSRVVTDGDAIQEIDLAARALWAVGARPAQPLTVPTWKTALLTRSEIEDGVRRIGATLNAAEVPYAPEPTWPFGAPLFVQCFEGDGLHVNDDHFLFELVDSQSGTLPHAGAEGELLVTDLAREGSPLLRYWSGYRTGLSEQPCQCGRTSAWTRSLLPVR